MIYAAIGIYAIMRFRKEGDIRLNYKKAIIELVEKIQSEEILKRIYELVSYLYANE